MSTPEETTPSPYAEARLMRLAVADGLQAIAVAALIAASIIFLGALVTWLGQHEFERDWPGRYWFSILPLLASGGYLLHRARALRD